MTLRPCKVTKLDDTFCRVDWEGEVIDVKTTCYASPQTITTRNGFWFFGEWPIGNASLDALLSQLGLTRNPPKKETAEERVRETLADVEIQEPLSGVTLVRITDLRAILADLDAARERVAELEARKPVDAEAVLGVFREALKALGDEMGSAEDEATDRSCLWRAARAQARHHGMSTANALVNAAITKAESILRGGS